MQITKSGIARKPLKLSNPYRYKLYAVPRRFPRIYTVDRTLGGLLWIVLGLLVPLILIEKGFNVSEWVNHTSHKLCASNDL